MYLADTSQGESGAENTLRTNDVLPGQEEPYGAVGARAGCCAIAQGNSAEIADALFQYSTPKEVMNFSSTCGVCATKCEC